MRVSPDLALPCEMYIRVIYGYSSTMLDEIHTCILRIPYRNDLWVKPRESPTRISMDNKTLILQIAKSPFVSFVGLPCMGIREEWSIQHQEQPCLASLLQYQARLWTGWMAAVGVSFNSSDLMRSIIYFLKNTITHPSIHVHVSSLV